MSRIALVAGPDAGHALPCVALGSALAARGHDVTLLTGRAHAPAAAAHHLRFLELPGLAGPGADDLGVLLWERAAAMTPALVALLRDRVRPELVVGDVLTRVGGFAAEVLGVPWVELSPHHTTEPSRHLPPIGLGRPPARTPWRAWDDGRIRLQQEASRASGREQERAARRRLGLPAAGGPVLRLLATVPALEPPRADWPPDAHVVGALDVDPLLPPLEPPPGDAPLVVVTDSTASRVDWSLGEVALRALRHTGLRVVVTTARTDLEAWPGAVVGRAPHGPLFDVADVAVTPGGGGSTAKALVRGVPLVVVPWHGDQRETAGRVAQAGLGRRLSPSRCTPGRLRRTVVRVLADARHRAAARDAAAGAAHLGPDHAAGLVEAVLARRAPGAVLDGRSRAGGPLPPPAPIVPGPAAAPAVPSTSVQNSGRSTPTS
ncbi:MAG: glycosyltransferase [Actinomycetes bacterium]